MRVITISCQTAFLILTLTASRSAAQTSEWPVWGGNAQRSNWEPHDSKFSKEDVQNFSLVWQRKLYNMKMGVGALLSPLIFNSESKEIAIVAGSENTLWAMDSSADEMYWTKHLDTAQAKTSKKNCNTSLTASPALNSTIYAVTGDGMLHRLNALDGSEVNEITQFVPAGVTMLPLIVSAGTIYTSTHASCGQEGAVWSIDASDPQAKPKSFKLGADVAGLGGVALGRDGTVFVQTQPGMFDSDRSKFGGALIALTKDLQLTQYFIMPSGEHIKSDPDLNITSPIVLTYKGQELVITANKDGRVYVLRASSVGLMDHHHFLSRTMVVPALDDKSHGISGALSTWEDIAGSRYVLVPVWGPLSGQIQSAIPMAKAPNGSIVAFKMGDNQDGAPVLNPVWVSQDLYSPMPAVIAKGVVFALSSGRFSASLKPLKGTYARLVALDGVTGEQLYSTGDQVNASGNLTGVSVSNGRIYFVTVDNVVQVFGNAVQYPAPEDQSAIRSNKDRR